MERQSTITPRDLELILCDETAEPKALPLSLLEEITAGFSDETEIGRGGFAVVYKGKLVNRTVAIKRLSNTYMYEKEFHREVECLMMVKHRNVVRFLGYCADTQGNMARHKGKFIMADVQQRLLCFEYVPKGSLHEYINDTSSGLQWRYRHQIINGICHGLHYLHQNNIVHLDLKPGNILLDANLVAKIADFGLSRCFDDFQSRIITKKIVGTLGYLAPEFCNGEITYQLDIFSLGIIIIEILTGKKGYHAVDKVVENWSHMLESDIQLKQVQICAEIGISCIDSNPAKRPDTKHIINRLSKYTETSVITPQQAKDASNELHQDTPSAVVGETTSEKNAIVSGINPYSSFQGNIANLGKMNKAVQNLNPNIKRCLEYCSIFPRGSKLRRDDLVHLWIAQEFVKTSSATDDMEDVAGGYIQELVSSSFLQPVGTTDCFTIHDVLHDILENVNGNYFRIENTRSHRGDGWEGDVPRHIQHLLIQYYDGEFIMETIIGLEYLRTLIVYIVEKDTPIQQKVIESICKRLPKLRVLAVAFSREHDPIEQIPREFSLPESVCQLEYLRYLAFRANSLFNITLPSTINKLQYIQLLDFGEGKLSDFTFAELVNLRHLFCNPHVMLPYVGRLSSLQTLPGFIVSAEQGCDLKQLRDLNKVRGSLAISCLHYVKSKGQALEANLADKPLTELKLNWNPPFVGRCSPEVQADVLEGLCPPVGLQTLKLSYFAGWRYPDWMVRKHSGGPKYLQELSLSYCSHPGPASGFAEAFPHLRVLEFCSCTWDALPENMEQLTALKELKIVGCVYIRLPTLPQSLEKFVLRECNFELVKSCKTVGHSNQQKIEHIPNIIIVNPRDFKTVSCNVM